MGENQSTNTLNTLKNLSRTERNEIAEQLRSARTDDRSINKKVRETRDRSGADYITNMHGLEHVFNYIRTFPEDKRLVYDLGAGTTRAISELKKTFGKDLNMKATVLSSNDIIQEHLGLENVLITPAESLRGIERESVACYLGSYSIDYTEAPQIVAQRLYETLVPGGLVKANIFDLPSHLPDEMIKAGFIVQIYEPEFGDESQSTVLFAIKPGEGLITSYEEKLQELFINDNTSYQRQKEKILQETQDINITA